MAAWTLTNADIVQAMPNKLADFYEKADSGSTTSATCARLVGLNDDEVIGSVVCFITGDNKGIDAVVNSFDSLTGELGFTALSNAIVSGDVFGIVSLDYQSYIERSYAVIKNEMRNMGREAELYLTESQVKELHLLKTMQVICMAKRQDATVDDIFHQSYLDFTDQYRNELISLKADYDKNEDGVISSDEEIVHKQVILG